MDQAHWDELYSEKEQIWSGGPNGALVTEAAELSPGRALDVGCGEGGDAVWLAARGWKVTAVDISPVAIERAKAGGAAGVEWQQADLAQTPPPAAAFDLVSAQYFPILHESGRTTVDGLLAAVAPGGTLLIVGHDLRGAHHPDWRGPDPDELYTPAEIATLLGRDWEIQVNETRERVNAPAGTHHVNDTVLRARRLR